MYATESIAEEALISARITYSYPQDSGPVGVYLCEDCGQYHLTSQGIMNKKLAALMASGKIRQAKQAEDWVDKIKRKHKRS